MIQSVILLVVVSVTYEVLLASPPLGGGSRDIPCSPTPVSPTLDQKVAFRLLVKNSSM